MMAEYQVRSPLSPEELRDYFHLRWHVLRKPWGQPEGSEKDDKEEECFQLAVFSADNKPLACGRLQLNSKDEAQIRFMAVHPQFQKKGLGRMIMQGLEEQAVKSGAKSVILQARENALDFYKSCGYQVKEKTFLLYDSIQHYLMDKQLADSSNFT
jgi:N-acetylglutamate synthase-like GNAT family acetyltransferase